MGDKNEDDPEIVIIDQSTNKEDNTNANFSKTTKLYINTGNIATWNSLKTRKTQIPANELHHCIQRTLHNWVNNITDKETDNSQNAETFESEDERSLIRVTVKVLLHKFDIKFLEEAVKTALESMKIKFFDTLILAIPPVEQTDEIPYRDVILPYWREMERLYSTGVASKLSSCDLDKEKLESLVDVAEVKPEVNQVNLTSCCHMPVDLVSYAKSNTISLQTHGDLPVMLPDQVISDAMKTIEPDNKLRWKTNWVVRYVVLIKCRGVIKSKGYIAAVEGAL